MKNRWFVTNKIDEKKTEIFDQEAKRERRSRTRHLEWLIEGYIERVLRERTE